jgi:hypothetical protein
MNVPEGTPQQRCKSEENATARRIAGVSEKVVGHSESIDANEILSRRSQVDKIDTVAPRTFGLDNTASETGTLNLNVLCGARALVQIAPTPVQ